MGVCALIAAGGGLRSPTLLFLLCDVPMSQQDNGSCGQCPWERLDRASWAPITQPALGSFSAVELVHGPVRDRASGQVFPDPEACTGLFPGATIFV